MIFFLVFSSSKVQTARFSSPVDLQTLIVFKRRSSMSSILLWGVLGVKNSKKQSKILKKKIYIFCFSSSISQPLEKHLKRHENMFFVSQKPNNMFFSWSPPLLHPCQSMLRPPLIVTFRKPLENFRKPLENH